MNMVQMAPANRRSLLHVLTPLAMNIAFATVVRLAIPYTLADGGERYRYYAMSLFFPIWECSSFHCFRVLPPMLVAVLPFELADAFIATGFIFETLAGTMFWCLAEHLHGSRRVAFWATAWFWVTWGPVQSFNDPLLITDPVQAFWTLASMYLLLTKRYGLALPLLVSGALVKESVLLVPMIYAVYVFLARDEARQKPVWLAVLIAAPLITWMLLRIVLSTQFGYVSYDDESYVRQTYFFGVWLPNLGAWPWNLTIAAVYIFGACGAAWILGALGLVDADRRQRALTAASIPAMVALALLQVPDRALATFPYATLLPAALVTNRLPVPLAAALVLANGAFSARMNASVSWAPRLPIALALLGVLLVAAVWYWARDRRVESGDRPAPVAVTAGSRGIALAAVGVVLIWLVPVAAVQAARFVSPAAEGQLNVAPNVPITIDDAGAPPVALSPDGTWLVFAGVDPSLPPGAAPRRLWRQQLGSTAAKPLAGTDRGGAPFFSPDGSALGFFADGQLKTLDFATGTVHVLADAPLPRGGAWSRRGTIVFAPQPAGALVQIPAAGGPVSTATALDGARQEQSHRWPAFLPDGEHFLFVARAPTDANGGLYVAALGASERERVSNDIFNAMHAGPGFLLIGREDGLWVQPFDLKRRRAFGGRTLLIRPDFGAGTNRAAFAASDTHVIFAVDRRERVDPPGDARPAWIDRDGRASAPPSGVVPFEAMLAERAVRSPDGSQLVRIVDEESQSVVRVRDVATGRERTLVSGLPRRSTVTSWSPDGRTLVGQSEWREGWNIWTMPVEPGSAPRPLLKPAWDHYQAQLSPDGRWIAYTGDEGGVEEVYVQAFPSAGDRSRVSVDGGSQPRWRADGREIVYVAHDRFFRAAPIDTSDTANGIRIALPRPLFERRLRIPEAWRRHFEYAMTADGTRFLANVATSPEPPMSLASIFRWRSALRGHVFPAPISGF